MNREKIQKIVLIITKIFFIGLLLQFFLQTLVKFKFGRDGTVWSIIWMWKEIIILILLSGSIYRTRKHKIRKKLMEKLSIKWMIIALLIFIVLAIINGLAINGTGVGATIISLRYSITGFVIFLIFSVISWEFIDHKVALERRYNKIIKALLRRSLFWRAVVYFIPRLLEFAGYNQFNYEGDINIAPPAAYYSQYNQGYVRNQFLFERPISRGFFLIAFWPMFFILCIKKRGRKAILSGGGLYGLVVLSTFSRAARIAWIIQTIILLMIEYRQNLKKAFVYGFLPILILFGGITYVGKDQIINRDFSNTGHLKNLELALTKIKNSPWFGDGPGTAGPASHHIGPGKEYNPENQFLQIRLEYGVVGFIIRMVIYLRFLRTGRNAGIASFNEKQTKQQKYLGYLVFSMALGMFGLGICGLVLHSFVDRMIVYPFMAMFGIIYGQYRLINIHNNIK